MNRQAQVALSTLSHDFSRRAIDSLKSINHQDTKTQNRMDDLLVFLCLSALVVESFESDPEFYSGGP